MTQNNSEATSPEKHNATSPASLPAFARSPINRCNLPALILGGLTFQHHPVPLYIDGIRELHWRFFRALDGISEAPVRALHFRQYMCSAFLLGQSEQAGLDPSSSGIQRDKADYLRLLRGWMFNADGIEAAVIKRWVESRFGLLTLNHRGALGDHNSEAYAVYQADYVRGLYNSNALETQLDLLYSYCQYELWRQWPERVHWRLYRGVNQLEEHDVINRIDSRQSVLLLNNLNSFSGDRDHSDTFGDVILEMQVPAAKLLYFPELLPGVLQGEREYLVIGGVYRTLLSR